MTGSEDVATPAANSLISSNKYPWLLAHTVQGSGAWTNVSISGETQQSPVQTFLTTPTIPSNMNPLTFVKAKNKVMIFLKQRDDSQ